MEFCLVSVDTLIISIGVTVQSFNFQHDDPRLSRSSHLWHDVAEPFRNANHVATINASIGTPQYDSASASGSEKNVRPCVVVEIAHRLS